MARQIIYYSMTGNTERVCRKLAERLGCRSDAIKAPFGPTRGFAKIIKLAFLALTGRRTRITAPAITAKTDDLLILGAQVWAGTLSTPMREFLATGPELPQRVGLVLTSGDPSYPTALFDTFGQMTNREVVATLHISETDAKSGRFDAQLKAFCDGLDQQKGAA